VVAIAAAGGSAKRRPAPLAALNGRMAKGSRTGWFGLPKAEHVYPGCGEKLTLQKSGSLWHESFPFRRTWHSRCRLAAGARRTLSADARNRWAERA
jgi:hypothetical protein